MSYTLTKTSLLCLVMLHFFTGMLMFSFKAYATTVEQQYDLTSMDIGTIVSFPEVGYLVLMLPAAILSAKYSRPKLMVIGCALMTVGAITYSLPHAICGKYTGSSADQNISRLVNKLCIPHLDSTENERLSPMPTSQGLTPLHNLTKTNRFEEVDSTVSTGESGGKCSILAIKLLLITGAFLVGAGAAPVLSLHYPYIDDHVSRDESPIYLGVLQAFAVIGIIGCYLLAGILINVHIDIGFANNSRTDRVGAWWLGFLVAAAGIVASGSPLWRLHDVRKSYVCIDDTDRSEITEAKLVDCKEDEPTGMWHVATRILRNPTVLTSLIAIACWHFQPILNGTFVLKYVQVQFGYSASASSVIVGLSTCLPAMFGIPLGGLLLSRGGWNLRKTLGFVIALLSLSCFVLPIGCASRDSWSEFSGDHGTCVQNCSCSRFSEVMPVCGDDRNSYPSPCHAGCTGFRGDEDWNQTQVFQSCGCLRGSSNLNGSSYLGACRERCDSHKFAVFLANFVLRGFLLCVSYIPFGMFLLRIGRVDEKALIVAYREVFGKLFGEMSGNIVMGKMFDISCVNSFRDDLSKCHLHDLHGLTNRFFLMNVIPSVCGTVMLVFAYSRLSADRKMGEL